MTGPVTHTPPCNINNSTYSYLSPIKKTNNSISDICMRSINFNTTDCKRNKKRDFVSTSSSEENSESETSESTFTEHYQANSSSDSENTSPNIRKPSKKTSVSNFLGFLSPIQPHNEDKTENLFLNSPIFSPKNSSSSRLFPSENAKTHSSSSRKSERMLLLEKFSEVRISAVVYNAEGISFNKRLLDGDNGRHCDVFELTKSEHRFLIGENAPDNSSLVLKFFNEKNIKKNGVELVKHMIPALTKQYKAIEKKYEMIKDSTLLPYARIYNIDTIAQDGYIVQERVIPCSLKTIKENSSYQAQIKEWFHDCLLDTNAPAWDLFKRNLGERVLEDGTKTLLIFDYYEYDDAFFLSAQEYIDDLSADIEGFREYILEGLDQKIEKSMDPSWEKDHLLELTTQMKKPRE